MKASLYNVIWILILKKIMKDFRCQFILKVLFLTTLIHVLFNLYFIVILFKIEHYLPTYSTARTDERALIFAIALIAL